MNCIILFILWARIANFCSQSIAKSTRYLVKTTVDKCYLKDLIPKNQLTVSKTISQNQVQCYLSSLTTSHELKMKQLQLIQVQNINNIWCTIYSLFLIFCFMLFLFFSFFLKISLSARRGKNMLKYIEALNNSDHSAYQSYVLIWKALLTKFK